MSSLRVGIKWAQTRRALPCDLDDLAALALLRAGLARSGTHLFQLFDKPSPIQERQDGREHEGRGSERGPHGEQRTDGHARPARARGAQGD